MPRPGRSRGTRSTRSPSSHLFSGFVIETYNHVDDLPVLSDAPKKRPRHATRGATAAERRQDSSSTGLPRRSSSRALRPDPVPMKPPPRSRDELTKALKHHDCTVCLRRGTVWMLLKCIRCARCVHSYCLNPPQTLQPKRGVWTCEPCARALPPQKKQAGRAFRNAVKTFPFLVPHGYLDAMTDDVALAAAADARSNDRHTAQQGQDFGNATTADPPEPTDPTENTVVLKVESDDSELDDLRPLAELRHPTAKEEEVFEDDHRGYGLCEPKRANTAPLPGDPPKARFSAAGMGQRERASASASPEIVPAASVQNGPAQLRASSAPAASGSADAIRPGAARAGGRGGRRGRAPRAGKERRVGEATKRASSGKEVWVKLRCKPPAPVFKERAKHVMDDKAKAEMCRRLAKARAKKAELRAIAMREKAAAEKAAAEKAATEKAPAGQQVATVKREDVMSEPGNTQTAQMGAVAKGAGSTAGTPKIGMPNIGAAVAQIAAMQGAVTPMAPTRNGFGTLDTSRASEPARDGLSSQATNRVGAARTTGENGIGAALGVASPRAQVNDRMNVPDRFAGNGGRPIWSTRRHDGALPMGRDYQRQVIKVSAADPYGTGNANADITDVVEIPDDSPQRSSVRMDRDETIKTKKRMYDGQLNGGSVRMEKEKKTAELMNSSSTPGAAGKSRRRERPTQSPSHGQLNEKERSGEVSCADVDAESVDEKDGAVKFTPEQRTVAKMATLFQSSMRSGVSNPKAVSANWGEIKLDAKNEALLTLAKVQKGANGKRRSSAGISSSSLDKDIRSAKTHRTDNVPESERKRMQATALMASGRSRATAGPSATESAAAVSRKVSISRLLIHPSAVASTEVKNSTHESVSLRRAHQVFDVDQSAMMQTDKHLSVNGGMDPSRMGDAVAGFNSQIHVPDVPDFQASQLRAARASQVDVASGDRRAGRRGQAPSLGPQWEDVPSEYEASRVPSRAVAIPSSHSGSQSEPGSATARGLTSVQTLKRPKKRPTLATLVTNRKRPPELEPARVVEVIDPIANEQASVGSRPSWSGTMRQGGVIQRPGQSQSSHEHEEQNSAMRPSYLETTRDGNSRRIADFGGQPMEPPAEPQSFKKRSRNDRYAGGNYGHIDSVQDVERSPVADTVFSAPAEGQYANLSASRGARSGGGAAQNYHESLNTQNQMSPLRQGVQGASHSSSQGPSPVCPGDYQRGPLADDPMRFSESRRLRRSVAPTVSTATRRFQYEQGRQLARFTSAAPSEQQQAYSAARRSRTQQRHPESGVQRTGTEWDAARENCSSTGQPMTSYPEYSHELPTNSKVVLNHHLIAQEGSRPQLVPIYESDSPRRSQTRHEVTWAAPSIPRLHESAHRPSPQSHRSPVIQGYHQDYARSAEQSRYPFSRYRALPQSRVPSAPVQPRTVFDRPREPSRPPISRLRDDGTSEPIAIDTRRSSYCQDMNSFGRTSGFSEHRVRSEEFASSARAMGEYVDDRAPAQAAEQAQPARTDPSLKNLLG